MNLNVPQKRFSEKFASVDWTYVFLTLDIKEISNSKSSGNFIVVGSTSSVCLALTWGGVTFPWTSAHVLVPLALGALGLVGFMIYEATVPNHPLVCLRFLLSEAIF